MRFAMLSSCLFFVASAFAAPPDVQPAISAKPGQLIRITIKDATEELGSARNFSDDEAFFGELVSPKGTRQFVFQAPTLPEDPEALAKYKSSYVLTWWKKGETEGAMTTITVSGAPSPIPAPDREPEASVDADLVKALQVAFDKDGGAPINKLVAVLKDASAKAKTTKSADQFTADLHNATTQAIGLQLAKTRDAIATYLDPMLPTEPGHVYTPAEQTKVSSGLAKVAAALAKLK